MAEAPLTAYDGFEAEPAFSPDGNQVAFSWRREGTSADLYVRLIGAGQPVQLTSTPEPEISPAWSPDGRWLAFLRRGRGTIDVYVMPSIGGGERRIAELHMGGSGIFATPSLRWTPDGSRLVAPGRVEPGNALGLLLIDVTTGEKRGLTNPLGQLADVGGAFSPDGRHVAFLRLSSGNPQGNIYLLEVDGTFQPLGEPSALTTDASQLGPPVWTADGRELLFPSNRTGRTGLWRVPMSGGTPVRVPLAGSDPRQPTVRGSRLAYVHQVSDTNIWALPTSGSGEPVRLVSSTLNDLTAQYSPDGSRIAFCSDQSGSSEIWVARSDGSRPEKLTSFGSGESCTPRWSPDSAHLVFDSNAEAGQFEIYVLRADGGQPRRLTNHPETDAIGSFSRDGQWIYFMSTRTGRAEVWKIPVSGGEPRQVTQDGGYMALESADGQTLFFSKAQLGPLWTMPVGSGPETKLLESVLARNFAPASNGIYFMEPTPEGPAVRFHDFGTGTVRLVATLNRPSHNVVSLSADERSLAYVQVDQAGSDIVLVDNFR